MSGDPVALSAAEAEALLDAAEAVIPCLQMSLGDAKSMREKLLAEGVPVTLGRDDHYTTG